MTKKPATILIVEDEESLNEAYQFILKKDGYEVLAAYDGQQALDLVDQKTPDLILLDLRMPNMEGGEFLRRYDMRKHPDVKVVVFSNYDTQTEIDEVYDLGATKYILKALASPAQLSRIVADTLKMSKE